MVRVVEVEKTNSTNEELAALVAENPGGWGHLDALMAREQTAGRGRGGNRWITPPGRALTASVLIGPRESARAGSWLPLLAGVAVVRAIGETWTRVATGSQADTGTRPDTAPPPSGEGRTYAPGRSEFSLKWPNDVLWRPSPNPDPTPDPSPNTDPTPDPSPGAWVPGWGYERKIGGILCRRLPGGQVVVGVGINTGQDAGQLPVAWAASLAQAGYRVKPRALLEAVITQLAVVLTESPAPLVSAHCSTLGQQIVADLPGGERLTGVAVGLGEGGELLARCEDGQIRPLQAAEIHHLRKRAQ